MSAGLSLVAVMVTVSPELPRPAVMPVRLIVCTAVLFSRSGAGLGTRLIVGGWLTGRIVTVNCCEMLLTPPLAVPPLSVAVTVITAEPLASVVGM